MKQRKLTDGQVQDIRQQLSDGVPVAFLSDVYGVSESLIKKIRAGYRNRV